MAFSISCPRFVKKHLERSSNSPGVACLSIPNIRYRSTQSLINSEPPIEIIVIDFIETNTYQDISIIGSCNGLVCLSYGRYDYFIWNPITRIFKKLLSLNAEIVDWESMMEAFRYNAVVDDYNIMCIFIYEGHLKVNIYSLKTNSWKKRSYSNDGIHKFSEINIFDGKLHICTGKELYDYGIDMDTEVLKVEEIISWDLEKEVYEIIEQPDYGEGVKNLLLAKIGGLFCIVCRKNTHADFWVMKKYGVKDSWYKMLTVSLSGDLPEDASIYPFIMLPTGDILVSIEGHFEVYNIKDNNKRVVETSGFDHFVHVESLISPTQYD